MTVNEGIRILLDIESKRGKKVFTKNTIILGCARLGGNHKIKFGKASDLEKEDLAA